MICRELSQNIESARAYFSQPPHDQATARCCEIVPVAIEDSILEERQRRLEAHLGEGADVALETVPVKGREAAVPRHVVRNQV